MRKEIYRRKREEVKSERKDQKREFVEERR